MIALALVAAFVAGMAGPASAADNGSTTATVLVQSGITLSGLSATMNLSGAPSVVANGSVSYSVETNNVAGYSVTVTPARATLLPGNTVTNTDLIPIAALTHDSDSPTFVPFVGTGTATVHVSLGRSANGGDALTTDYRMVIPVVNEDTYTVALNYIAVSA